jgi:hypothetical protein
MIDKDYDGVIKLLSVWVQKHCSAEGISKIYFEKSDTPSSLVLEKICRASLPGTISLHGVVLESEAEEDKGIELYKLAKLNNGVVASSLDYTYSKFCRKYSKARQNLADIFPLKSLLYSEVVEIAEHLTGNTYEREDDWEMQEWAIHIDQECSIVSSVTRPNANKKWPYLTMFQKSFVAALHAREKKTKHKDIVNKPVGKFKDLRFLLCRERFSKELL